VDHQTIYAEHAEEYDRLVEAEDCEKNLLPAIARIAALGGREVLEVGAGTGRVTRLLVDAGARVRAFDRSGAMLAVARRHLGERCRLAVADAEALPVPDGWADLAIAGWVFGHFRSWMAADWRAHVGRGLAEMRRALKPGAPLVVIETLGTGSETPAPPSPELAEYYAWLEAQGFARAAIRTDYRFASVDEAAAVTGFFFGPAFAARVRAEGWARVPECTGIWFNAGSPIPASPPR
jgi:ubiquinone/menaquinone biosynthesis C-methylase UbiE